MRLTFTYEHLGNIPGDSNPGMFINVRGGKIPGIKENVGPCGSGWADGYMAPE